MSGVELEGCADAIIASIHDGGMSPDNEKSNIQSLAVLWRVFTTRLGNGTYGDLIAHINMHATFELHEQPNDQFKITWKIGMMTGSKMRSKKLVERTNDLFARHCIDHNSKLRRRYRFQRFHWMGMGTYSTKHQTAHRLDRKHLPDSTLDHSRTDHASTAFTCDFCHRVSDLVHVQDEETLRPTNANRSMNDGLEGRGWDSNPDRQSNGLTIASISGWTTEM
jgi:hypothetical protein